MESGEWSEGECYPGAKDGKFWKSFGFSPQKAFGKVGENVGGDWVDHPSYTFKGTNKLHVPALWLTAPWV